MRYMLTTVAAGLFLLANSGTAMVTAAPAPHSAAHRLSSSQAQRIMRLVARHDGIDLSDTHVEVNSLDLMSPFIPGYASFILIREAMTPGPDQTLRRYAVNRRTGDVWEMTQCTRYDFPALTKLQEAMTGHVSDAAEIAAERRELGCSAPKSGAPAASTL
jgi:hypothetical protein